MPTWRLLNLNQNLNKWVHQENIQLHFGNLHFDIKNFEQLFLLYKQLSLQDYIFDFNF